MSKKSVSYAELNQQLNSLVEELENLPEEQIEEQLAKFEQAEKLIAQMREILQNSENKIVELSAETESVDSDSAAADDSEEGEEE